MALFRTGALPIAIETGRYSSPQVHLNDRLGKLCDNSVVEDEQQKYHKNRLRLKKKCMQCVSKKWLDFITFQYRYKFLFHG
jgi:hypothetical protein